MRRYRHRRGGGFLLFILALLPLSMVGLSLVTDYSVTVMAHRHVATGADSVAMAAGTAFSALNPYVLDRPESQLRAQQMFDEALRTGMIPEGLFYEIQLAPPRFPNPGRVEITINYRTPDLFVASFLSGRKVNVRGTVTRSAEICFPSLIQPCAYPS